MGLNEFKEYYENILQMGDGLDKAGGGALALTEVDSTRKVTRLELGLFALYLAKYCSVIDDNLLIVINSALDGELTIDSTDTLERVIIDLNEPDPTDIVSLQAFIMADKITSLKDEESTPKFANALISLYKIIGQVMLELIEKPDARLFYDNYIHQMEEQAGLNDSVNEEGESVSSDNFDSGNFTIVNTVLISYNGDEKEVIIPEGITRIGDGAFYRNENFFRNGSIERIVLPNSVQVIGNNSFRECMQLKSINLPEGLTEIGSGAFSMCLNLENVELPSTVKSIGEGAFYKNGKIKSITIPNNIRAICDDTFRSCINLENINLPEGLTTIGDGAFFECLNLESIDLPATIETIGENAFASCFGMKCIRIPSSNIDIGDNAFSLCIGLKKVIVYGEHKRMIPKRIKDIFPDYVEVLWEETKANNETEKPGTSINEGSSATVSLRMGRVD